jgi:hypothetical protein
VYVGGDLVTRGVRDWAREALGMLGPAPA